jgi:hypothetical protein
VRTTVYPYLNASALLLSPELVIARKACETNLPIMSLVRTAETILIIVYSAQPKYILILYNNICLLKSEFILDIGCSLSLERKPLLSKEPLTDINDLRVIEDSTALCDLL